MSTPVRERLYTTEAIILSRRDLGEADRILTLFTPYHGKFSVIAKGSRRTKSRSGPHLDVLSRTSLDLAKGRDLDVVTSAQLIDNHDRFQTDLDAYCAAGYLAELVRHLTEERQEQQPVYHLLKNSLAVLNDGVDSWPVMRHFELALLSILGYQPELYQCVNCGEEITARVNSWSPVLGGILCPACGTVDPGALPLSVNAQKYLRTIQRSGLGTLMRLELGESDRLQVERALANSVKHVAERDFGSLRVMSSLRQALGTG
jgi:DNA repair protein RecO (recombination protein O)